MKLGELAESPRAADCGIQRNFEVYERVRRPEPSAQLFARNNLAGALHEGREHLKRLLTEGDCNMLGSFLPSLGQLNTAKSTRREELTTLSNQIC